MRRWNEYLKNNEKHKAAPDQGGSFRNMGHRAPETMCFRGAISFGDDAGRSIGWGDGNPALVQALEDLTKISVHEELRPDQLPLNLTCELRGVSS